MSRWALVPTKGFDRGKSRLASVLSSKERTELAQGLFEHVVGVLCESPGIEGVAVVSDSAEARDRARSLGALALADMPGSRGLAEVVDGALAELQSRGATSVIICMSDLPDVNVEEIVRVSEALNECDVVLVPDLGGHGTNIVAVKPPTMLPSCLGHEDSLHRHQRRATELGLSACIQVSPGIGFDLDRPDDLDRFRARRGPAASHPSQPTTRKPRGS